MTDSRGRPDEVNSWMRGLDSDVVVVVPVVGGEGGAEVPRAMTVKGSIGRADNIVAQS